MPVSKKLTPEIQQYILQRYRAIPRPSHADIAEEVSERFQVDVSKQSITYQINNFETEVVKSGIDMSQGFQEDAEIIHKTGGRSLRAFCEKADEEIQRLAKEEDLSFSDWKKLCMISDRVSRYFTLVSPHLSVRQKNVSQMLQDRYSD